MRDCELSGIESYQMITRSFGRAEHLVALLMPEGLQEGFDVAERHIHAVYAEGVGVKLL